MTLLRGEAESLGGEPVELSGYEDKTVLVVNTASKCGLTPQFEGLEKLYEERKDDGFVILGFPSDDFNQELGSDEEVGEFCQRNYGVTFPMFSSAPVKGDAAQPLFRRLIDATGEEPTWNFSKYLIAPGGEKAEYIDPGTEPPDIGPKIDALAGKQT
ncbi:MAG: glutathione peroxidase [Thermoleophilaceae bacterium]|nr:glutathione peroxidase [Thermoleophilaceae bacterium]